MTINPERSPNNTDVHAGKHDRLSFLDDRRFRLLFLLIGGTLTALTLIFTELWLFEWITLIPAALVVLRMSEGKPLRLRTWYGYGFMFFWGYQIVVFHWFVSMYPLSFTGLSEGAALFVVFAGVFGVSLIQALVNGLAFVVYGLTARHPFVERHPFLRPFLFAASWTVFEWVETFGWWGVPWGRLALGQIDLLPGVATAQWFGSYFISFLLISVNLCLAYAILHADRRKIAAATACGIFVCNLLCGSALLLSYRDHGKKITVASIQGNISNKWDFSTLGTTKRIYREYTLLAAEKGADIVVWSETALPYDLGKSGSVLQFVKDLAKEAGVTLIVGAFRSETDAEGNTQEYNSLYAIAPDGTVNDTLYDKQKLVPFGEFVPLRALVTTLFPPLADVGMLDDDLSKGESGKNIETSSGTVGGMICFDSIYESVALSAVRNGAELLCLSSNDAWFLDSAAIYMHHDQARLRAIETGRYLVRSGNSGITSVIRPTGEVLTELEPLTEGYVISDVYLRTDRTLYSVIGNLFVYALIGGLVVICTTSAYFHVRNTANRRKKG